MIIFFIVNRSPTLKEVPVCGFSPSAATQLSRGTEVPAYDTAAIEEELRPAPMPPPAPPEGEPQEPTKPPATVEFE